MSIANVQDIGVRLAVGGSTDKTITISAPAAGSTLSLFIACNDDNTISAVTGGGVTWSRVIGPISEGVYAVEQWVGHNSSGSGTTITISVSATYAAYECNFSEWSGMDTAGVADPAASDNSGTSGTASTDSVTPTAGKEVLLLAAVISRADITDSPSGSFTALAKSATADDNVPEVVFSYRIVASASGSYSTSYSLGVSYLPWVALIGGWDAASAGGPVIPVFMNQYRQRVA